MVELYHNGPIIYHIIIITFIRIYISTTKRGHLYQAHINQRGS